MGDRIPVPKPGEGEPIVFFDITLNGKKELRRVRSTQYVDPL